MKLRIASIKSKLLFRIIDSLVLRHKFNRRFGRIRIEYHTLPGWEKEWILIKDHKHHIYIKIINKTP